MKTLPGPSEEEFLGQFLQLARLLGWRTFHARPGWTRKGPRTCIQGDGVGFPDSILLRAERAIVCELKVLPNVPTDAQLKWLAAFRAVGVPAFVWYPEDWALIEKELE